MVSSDESVKTTLDLAAATITIATIMKWLPAIAAAFTIVWTAIRIYESKTVQGWLHRKKPPD